MPAVNKAKRPTKKAKSTVAAKDLKKKKFKSPKSSLKGISSKLGQVKKIKSKHPYDPIKANRGVVYIKHIPHGFYEEQMRKYFSQFGKVTNVRVARSERTGRSKGYAFVEFRVPEVAQIAAETMNNYMMFKQVLKTAYIPPDKQKQNYFRSSIQVVRGAKGVSHLVTPQILRTEQAIKEFNKVPTDKQHADRVERSLYKLRKQQEKLAALNIKIDIKKVTHKSDVVEEPAAVAVSKNALKKQKKMEKLKRKQTKIEKPLNDDTLSKLVNETLQTENDEDSSQDEDYVAETPIKKAVPSKKVKKSNNDTLDKLLNETIEEDDSSDDDFQPDDSDGKIVLSKKGKKSNDSTLDRLINETIEEDDSSDDEDFEPDDDSDNEETSDYIAPSKKGKKSNDNTLDRLINETIEEDDSSDDDFVIDYDEDSESPSFLESPPSKKGNKGKKSNNDTLDKLLNETIEDSSSDDEDFVPEVKVVETKKRKFAGKSRDSDDVVPTLVPITKSKLKRAAVTEVAAVKKNLKKSKLPSFTVSDVTPQKRQPEPKPKERKSTLQFAGIQKRSKAGDTKKKIHKVADKKTLFAATELIKSKKSSASPIKTVKAGDLKKKKGKSGK